MERTLSDAYFKTRRSYMVVAGLLAAWELAGISLSAGDFKPSGGFDVVLSVRTPEIGVWIIAFMLLYLAMRMSSVWLMHDVDLRQMPSARFDYWMSHVLAGLAVLLWAGQTIFADFKLGESVVAVSQITAALTGAIAILVTSLSALRGSKALKERLAEKVKLAPEEDTPLRSRDELERELSREKDPDIGEFRIRSRRPEEEYPDGYRLDPWDPYDGSRK